MFELAFYNVADHCVSHYDAGTPRKHHSNSSSLERKKERKKERIWKVMIRIKEKKKEKEMSKKGTIFFLNY